MFEYIVIAEFDRGFIAQIFVYDSTVKGVERRLRIREVRCVLVEQLVREAYFIVPIENTVITEIRTYLSTCIGTFVTINCRYRKL